MNLGLGLFLGARSGGAFDPSKLANVAHWYRSDLGITLNATTVSQWSDQVGTANLVQATGANQLTYNAADAGYGGKPTLQATAIGQFMAAAAIATSQPVTFWIVGEYSNIIVSLSTGFLVGQSGGVALNAGALLTTGVPNAAKHAHLHTFNGATSFAGVDNWLTGGASGNAGTANGTAIGVLAFPGGTGGGTGKIAEFVIQAGTPTAAEKTSMAAYFTARYGVTIT